MRRERATLVALARTIIDGEGEVPGVVLRGEPERLEVYRYGFGARTRRALENTFPRTRAALGEARWLQEGARYSAGPGAAIVNLNDVGRDFPGFLSSAPLAELARVEWLMVEASRAASRPPLGVPELAVGPVALQPHVRLLALRYNTLARLAEPTVRSRRLARAVVVRISQSPHGALVRPLSTGEHALVRQVMAGRSLAGAVARTRLPEAELARVLASWVSDGVVTRREPGRARGARGSAIGAAGRASS